LKKLLILLALLSANRLFAQSKTGTSAPAATTLSGTTGPTIKYDFRLKSTVPYNTPIPYDQRFYLEIDSIQVNGISKISVFKIRYRKGKGKIIDRVTTGKTSGTNRPSFELKGLDTATGKNTLTLHFPALKPEKDWDILIHKQFSKNNLARALAINKSLDADGIRQKDGIDSNADIFNALLVGGKVTMCTAISTLKDSANANDYGANLGSVFNEKTKDGKDKPDPDRPGLSIPIVQPIQYKKYVYDYLAGYYDVLIRAPILLDHSDPNKYWKDKWLTQANITLIAGAIPNTDPLYKRIAVLQKLRFLPGSDDNFSLILQGYYQFDSFPGGHPADAYDFTTRMRNLTATAKLLDSLQNSLLVARAKEAAGAATSIQPAIDALQILLTDANHNNTLFTATYNGMTRQLLTATSEARWVIGNTASQDLATLGSRRFTVDAGLTTIGVYNNQRQFKPILKLVISGDFYFRSIDKNLNYDRIAPVPDDDYAHNNHILESRKNFFERFSLSVGATLGSMGNKDFDNFYSSFSFTFGPSYVIMKGVKVSSGVALLKRFDNNPLETSQEKTIVGPYVSLIADYDLIGALANLTQTLFK